MECAAYIPRSTLARRRGACSSRVVQKKYSSRTGAVGNAVASDPSTTLRTSEWRAETNGGGRKAKACADEPVRICRWQILRASQRPFERCTAAFSGQAIGRKAREISCSGNVTVGRVAGAGGGAPVALDKLQAREQPQRRFQLPDHALDIWPQALARRALGTPRDAN